VEKELPNDFAGKILDLELKMEEDLIRHENIMKLVELYSVFIN
tara:strand:- start:247 stop:375 length:129 start_codon:yes stop_codon:yes gene_type:complete